MQKSQLVDRSSARINKLKQKCVHIAKRVYFSVNASFHNNGFMSRVVVCGANRTYTPFQNFEHM